MFRRKHWKLSISEGKEDLILGLIWQITRHGLLRLCEDGEIIEDLLRLTLDQFLIRWFNYHLKAAGWYRRVNNFSKDVNDGENYTVLLNQLTPEQCSRTPLQPRDFHADTIGCRKYLTVPSLLSGNPRLNLAFVANLFNNHPGLEPLDEQEAKDYGVIEDFDAEGDREARVFTLWLTHWTLIILQAFGNIIPGSVVWRCVNKAKAVGANTPGFVIPAEGEEEDEVAAGRPGLACFKAVENTNYAVDLASQNKLHMVGVQGADIVDGTRTLVLGLVWQLMRCWANTTAQKHKPSVKPIRSFKDPSITIGVFFLELLDSMQPGIVDFSMVSNSFWLTELAISIARKMEALIFLVPEDIVDVRPRLILTHVGSLVSLGRA
ncbi:calponin homology domain-containing protein [Hysterangium stoloniferum]|nr:calponin homology domain-containing protein [Hysterangium stoloniferum]